jgi:protein tyrosine phosphatase
MMKGNLRQSSKLEIVEPNPFYFMKKNKFGIEVTVISLKNNENYHRCPRCQIYWPWQATQNYEFYCNRCCLVLIGDVPDHDLTKKILEVRQIQLDTHGKEWCDENWNFLKTRAEYAIWTQAQYEASLKEDKPGEDTGGSSEGH